MAAEKPSSDPAPWEAPGKRHTQMYGAGGIPPQPAPQGYPARPGPQPPQAPQQGYPQAPAYPQPPAQPQAPAYPPPPQGFAQPAPAYPPPPGAQPGMPQAGYPQPAYPPGYGAQPAYYSGEKPTSVLAIISLVCAGLGLVTGISVLAGLVLGIIALRETRPAGTKSGRGLAIAGVVVNGAFMAIGALLFALLFAGTVALQSQMEDLGNISVDGSLIAQRTEMYFRDRGDLAGGGNRYIGGYKNAALAEGPLTVDDLVSQAELKMPMDRYFLEVKGESAVVWYTAPDGQKQMAGSFSVGRQKHSQFDEDWQWD